MGSSQDAGDSSTIALALQRRKPSALSTPCTREQRSAQDYTFEALVGDPEEELWTETASFASSLAIVASVTVGEDRGCPSCTSHSSFSVSRSETERISGVALGWSQ